MLGTAALLLGTTSLAHGATTTKAATTRPQAARTPTARHADPHRPAPPAAARSEDIQVVAAGGARRARARLRTVPGNSAVIDAKEVDRGRNASLEDTLAYQPGIYAQATSGSTANKISIRGSGAGVFYGGYSLGTQYLIDGMTVSGVGGFQEDRMSPIGYQRTEVLYGANAFEYGATALGGAIDFIAATGQSNPGAMARWEGGSFGTSIEQLSDGGTFDHRKGDYYITVARTDRQGFQDYTRTYRTDVDANLGYQINDRLSVRLIGRWDEGETHYGGLLTLAQLRQDPSQNPNNWGERPTESLMFGLKTTYDIDDASKLDYGITDNRYTLFNDKQTLQPQLWRSTDVNNVVRYTRHDTPFGRPSDTTVTLSDVHMVSGDARYYNTGAKAIEANEDDWKLNDRTDFGGSHDSVLALGNTSEVANRLWLTTGLSAIWIERDVAIAHRAIPNPQARNDVDYSAVFLAPRLGLRYALTPRIDVFANASRSIDAPVTWEYQNPDGGSGYASTAAIGRLEAQRAYTVELGVRGDAGPFEASLTAYRSWIHDELLSVVVVPQTATTAEVDSVNNASPTIHQGLELGLTTHLLDSGRSGSLSFRQSGTVNDFHYVHDAALGSNQLPALPRWVYQAELFYQHPTGFYANLNLRASSSYYVDYANTLKAPSYGIWGLKLGYEAPGKRWSAFVDFRNLTDKHYVTASYTQYNLRGLDSAAFYPGDGFGVFGGVTLHLNP